MHHTGTIVFMRIAHCLVFLFLWNLNVHSQTTLTNSRTAGPVTQVYRLTDKETEALINDPKAVTDAFFHTLADTYTEAGKAKRLAFGNYLQVRAVKNNLEYYLLAYNNIRLSFVNNYKDFQFTLADMLGNSITNARPLMGLSRPVAYNKQARLYMAPYPGKEGFIKVVYNGNSNYFTYDADERDSRHYKSFWQRISYTFPVRLVKKWFSKNKTRKTTPANPHKRFLVFSKPKYKPYDTVKFKAYVLTTKGDNIKPVTADVMLEGPAGSKKIASLTPYNPGAYEYQFVLADSLHLRLDANYTIRLADSAKDGVQYLASGSFRYEDYELKSLSFNVRSDKFTHYPGEPVTIFMKATDENDLAVPDARVEIVARVNNVTAFYGDSVFVKDTLWAKNLTLDPVGETKLLLPDSIFPNAALSFSLDIKMLNSNNETRTSSQHISFDTKNVKSLNKITARFIKDSLYFTYVESGLEKPQTGWLHKNAASGERIGSQRVQLPWVMLADYRAEDYELKLDNGMDTIIGFYDFPSDLRPVAVQKEKTLSLAVANPHKIPFWYTVFSGNKTLLKGYVNHLDTTIKHSSKQAAHFRINYFWDDEEQSQEVSTFYNASQLNVKLLAPDVVYPGQKVNMKIRVLDPKEQPVADADVTAYAHTSKFQSPPVTIPKFGRIFYQRKQKPFLFESDEIFARSAIAINWQRWARELGLDTITYYKFTHPQPLYITTEPARDSLTQFAPFVMKDGDFEAVNIVYVDELPVFYYDAQQLQNYSFAIQPGRHSIKLRTPYHEVWIKDFYFKKGEKTIFSVLADTANKQAHVVEKKPVLSDTEAERLNRYMVRVMDNFEAPQTYIHDDSAPLWLNPPPALGSRGHDRLVGPLKQNMLYFESGNIKQAFFKEPGYTYTFSPGLIKQKSYKGLYAFDTTIRNKHPFVEAYKQQALSAKDYDSIWTEYLNLRSRTTQLFRNNIDYDTTAGRLEYKIDTAFTNRLPYIKNILISNQAKPQNLLVLNGNNPYLPALPAGQYTLLFLLQDNRHFKAEKVNVVPGGINYYSWKSFKVQAADSFSLKLDSSIKATKATSWRQREVPSDIVLLFNSNGFDFSALKNTMTGRVMDAATKKPIAGASVIINGLMVGIVSDEKGRFKINVPNKGKVQIAAIGFNTKEVNARNGDTGDIELESAPNTLDEVVVVGYGFSKKQNITGSIATIKSEDLQNLPVANVSELLQGKVAGLNVGWGDGNFMVRGNSSTSAAAKPLIIVDGLPFDGDLNVLNPNDIESLNVLKDADAVAIYGTRAAHGVIIIKTKNGSTIVNDAGTAGQGGQRLRTRFSDEAFWQPQLITNEEGEASFTVTFPDDITSWKARVIAINGKKQSGYLETAIKSFKTLSANFVSPLFAIEGDSMTVLGKLMNYTPVPEKLTRTFKYNDQLLRSDSITVTNAHIDSVTIAVNGTDSLSFEYALQQSNGYFDGELRKLPVYAAGVKETVGRFIYMDKGPVAAYTFEKDKGPGTVRAEASVFPVLLDEMRQLRDYEYLCNEQLASKLKSLLLEKKLRSYLQEPFEYEKHIGAVIKKLDDNKTIQNLWGWWQGSAEETWISLHVVEALLQAELQGYKTTLNKNILYRYLLGKVADAGPRADLNMVKLLHTLDGSHNIKDWINLKQADSIYIKQKKTLYEWLQLEQLKQMAGMAVQTDSLMKWKKETMFGGFYWGDDRYHFWNNSIQNTLIAYKILKTVGGYEKELGRIRQYFLEQRRDGQWRNTYESSLILETILPDLFNSGEKPKPATATINGETISRFPFEKTYAAGEEIVLQKQGVMPLYFTAYQQYQNKQPQKISKDFEVNSYLVQSGARTNVLKAGKTAILRVEVTARADAEYVMVEIPVPAGCSYENKLQHFWGAETHREYFKNKTAVFCTKLKQGKYIFDIELMPRYTGSYVLNPAKAEMMYFPVFYGREGMKKTGIE